MDEDINFCTEQIGQVKKVPEFDYKNRLKVAGTPLKVLKINTQESCNNPMVKMEQITSSSYINMAYIRLYLEMSRIHGSFEQPDNAVFSEQKLSSIKRTVAAKTTESRVMSLSDQKADSLNEQSDCSEEKRKAAIVKQHTKKEEVNHNKKIKRPGDFLEESDSPQDQKPALNNNMKRLRKLKKNEQQAKDVKPTVRNRELEGLEIKYDRELMSEFDEGIDLNDSNKHSNDLGIYPNVYRVADCKRKLRIRRSYPLSAKMYVEEFQIKKEKNIQPSNNHGATIHKYSNSITKEVIPYANLMARFQEFEKNDSLNTSEASTSTRVHSNNLELAQMEDLDFTDCGDGILFGKYAGNCGVIQFLEGKKRDRAKLKRSNVKLLLLSGELEVTVATEKHILKPMGFMIIHRDTEYEMRNSYKGVSMVVFFRERILTK